MSTETKIICKHELDYSSLENLANDIAQRLNCNIEYGQYQNNNGKHEFIQLGVVEANPNGIISTIYDMRNNNSSEYSYVLELGEEAKLIYNSIIQVLPPWEEEFDTVFNNFNSQGFAEESYYLGVFEELKKLGGDKVYFIKDTNEPNLELKNELSFNDYLKLLKDEATFFEVEI